LGELCLKSQYYLLDTHALIFWNLKQGISQEFIQFLDYQDRLGNLFISAISFWEIALLIQRGKLALTDIYAWKEELFQNTNLQLINPTVDKMIEATRLPNHRKDPFSGRHLAHPTRLVADELLPPRVLELHKRQGWIIDNFKEPLPDEFKLPRLFHLLL
jgi:PIN domain nuclease of toxin-antitoxin system